MTPEMSLGLIGIVVLTASVIIVLTKMWDRTREVKNA